MAQRGAHGHHPPQQAVAREVAVEEGTNAAARRVAQGQDSQRRGCWTGPPNPVSCSKALLQRCRGLQGVSDAAETWGSAVGGGGTHNIVTAIADPVLTLTLQSIGAGIGHVPSPSLSLLVFRGGAHTLWGWREASERGTRLTMRC